jgi:hypothetical protein
VAPLRDVWLASNGLATPAYLASLDGALRSLPGAPLSPELRGGARTSPAAADLPRSAYRAATSAQTEAMVHDSFASSDECFLAVVADPGGWGAWTFSSYAQSHIQTCNTGNGVTATRYVAGAWLTYWSGSSGQPPTHNTIVNGVKEPGVPDVVFLDLEQLSPRRLRTPNSPQCEGSAFALSARAVLQTIASNSLSTIWLRFRTQLSRHLTTSKLPPEHALQDAGITPSLAVSVPGVVSLPFVISGTDMFGFVPERLARRCADRLNRRIVTTPLSLPMLVDTVHWHPMNADEAGVRWLIDALLSLQLVDAPSASPP